VGAGRFLTMSRSINKVKKDGNTLFILVPHMVRTAVKIEIELIQHTSTATMKSSKICKSTSFSSEDPMNQYCFLFLLCGLGITTVFVNPIYAADGKQIKKPISAEARSALTDINSLTFEPSIISLKDGYPFTILSKSFDQLPGPKVILAFRSDGNVILNPQTSEFPKTASLIGLTWEQARALLGEGVESTPQTKTFDLMHSTGTHSFREKHLYWLDTKFHNGVLRAYRVRANELRNQDWISVE